MPLFSRKKTSTSGAGLQIDASASSPANLSPESPRSPALAAGGAVSPRRGSLQQEFSLHADPLDASPDVPPSVPAAPTSPRMRPVSPARSPRAGPVVPVMPFVLSEAPVNSRDPHSGDVYSPIQGGGQRVPNAAASPSPPNMSNSTFAFSTPQRQSPQAPPPSTPTPSGGTSNAVVQVVASQAEADTLVNRLRQIEKENVQLAGNLQHICDENAQLADRIEVLQQKFVASRQNVIDVLDAPSLLADIRDPDKVKGWFGSGNSTSSKAKESMKEMAIRMESEYMSYRNTHASSNDEVRTLIGDLKRAHLSAESLSKIIAETRKKGECALIVDIRKSGDGAPPDASDSVSNSRSHSRRGSTASNASPTSSPSPTVSADLAALQLRNAELTKEIKRHTALIAELETANEQMQEQLEESRDVHESLTEQLAKERAKTTKLEQALDEARSASAAADDVAGGDAAAALAADLAAIRAELSQERSARDESARQFAQEKAKMQKLLTEATAKLTAQQDDFSTFKTSCDAELEALRAKVHAAESVANVADEAKRAASEERSAREGELWGAQERLEAELSAARVLVMTAEAACSQSDARCLQARMDLDALREATHAKEAEFSAITRQLQAEKAQHVADIAALEQRLCEAQEKMAKMDLLMMEQQETIVKSQPGTPRASTPNRSRFSFSPSRRRKSDVSEAHLPDLGPINPARFGELQAQVDRLEADRVTLEDELQAKTIQQLANEKKVALLNEQLAATRRLLDAATSAAEEERNKSAALEAAVRAEHSSPKHSGGGVVGLGQSPDANPLAATAIGFNAKLGASPDDDLNVSRPATPPASPSGASAAALEQATNAYMKDLKEKDAVIANLQKRNVTLQQQVAQMDADLDSTVSLAKFSALEVAVESLQSELKTAQQALEVSNATIKEKDVIIENLRIGLRDAKSKGDSAERSATDATEAVASVRAELAKETKRFSKELEAADAATKHVQEQFNALKKKMDAESASREKQKKSQRDDDSDEAKTELAELNDKVDSLTAEVSRLSSTVASQKKDLDNKIRQLNAQDEVIRGLRKGLSEGGAIANNKNTQQHASDNDDDDEDSAVPRAVAAVKQKDSAPPEGLQEKYNDLLTNKVRNEQKAKRKITHLEQSVKDLEDLVKDLQIAAKKLSFEKVVAEQQLQELQRSSSSVAKTAATGRSSSSATVGNAPSSAKTKQPSSSSLESTATSATVTPDQYYRVKCEVDELKLQNHRMLRALQVQEEDYKEMISKLEAKVRSQTTALLAARIQNVPVGAPADGSSSPPARTPERGAKMEVVSPLVTNNNNNQALRIANEQLIADREGLLKRVSELEEAVALLTIHDGSDQDDGDAKSRNGHANSGTTLKNATHSKSELLASLPGHNSHGSGGRSTATLPHNEEPELVIEDVGEEEPTKSKASKTRLSRSEKKKTQPEDVSRAAERESELRKSVAAAEMRAREKDREIESLLSRVEELEKMLESEQTGSGKLHETVLSLRSQVEGGARSVTASALNSPHQTPSKRQPSVSFDDNESTPPSPSAVGTKSVTLLLKEVSDLKRQLQRSASDQNVLKTDVSVLSAERDRLAIQVSALEGEVVNLKQEANNVARKAAKGAESSSTWRKTSAAANDSAAADSTIVSDLSEKLKKLQSALDEERVSNAAAVAGTATKHRDVVVQLEAEIEKCHAEADELEERHRLAMEAMEDRLEEARQEALMGATQRATAHELRIEALEAAAKTSEEERQALGNQVKFLEEQLEKRQQEETEIKSARKEKDALNDSRDSNDELLQKTMISELSAANDALAAELAAARGELDTLRKEVAQSQLDLKAVNEERDKAKSELEEAVKASRSSRGGAAAAAATTTTAEQKELKALRRHVEYLEEQQRQQMVQGDAAELVRLAGELVSSKQRLAEYMAVTDRLGLRYPFSDAKLERAAKIRLSAVTLLEATANAKYYLYRGGTAAGGPSSGSAGGSALMSARSASAPAPARLPDDMVENNAANPAKAEGTRRGGRATAQRPPLADKPLAPDEAPTSVFNAVAPKEATPTGSLDDDGTQTAGSVDGDASRKPRKTVKVVVPPKQTNTATTPPSAASTIVAGQRAYAFNNASGTDAVANRLAALGNLSAGISSTATAAAGSKAEPVEDAPRPSAKGGERVKSSPAQDAAPPASPAVTASGDTARSMLLSRGRLTTAAGGSAPAAQPARAAAPKKKAVTPPSSETAESSDDDLNRSGPKAAPTKATVVRPLSALERAEIAEREEMAKKLRAGAQSAKQQSNVDRLLAKGTSAGKGAAATKGGNDDDDVSSASSDGESLRVVSRALEKGKSDKPKGLQGLRSRLGGKK